MKYKSNLKSKHKYILILGGEFPLRERVLAGAIRAGDGIPVFTIAKNKMVPALKFFDGVLEADVMSPAAVLASVVAYEEKTGMIPAAVIPMNDFVVRSGRVVAEHYTLFYNSAETVEACRDKYKMKQVLAEAGLPVPRFEEFSTLEQLEKIAQSFKFPVVIKPRELAGSVAVIKVNEFSELGVVFRRCLREVEQLGGAFKTRDDIFQIEEFIPSNTEVSIEVINHKDFRRVLAVTDKYLGEEPYFVEVGHSVPSHQSSNEELKNIALAACAALGIEYGMAHVEARITPSGEIKLIEIGARTGGDAIMDLIERTYGVNPYQFYVESLLGKKPSVPEELIPLGLSAVAFLKAKTGRISEVLMPKILPASVTNLQVTAKPMDMSYIANSWKHREGSVEFFFPKETPRIGYREHLHIAESLSQSLFQVNA